MKSIKRLIFLSLFLALVVVALPNQPAVVTAQEETDLTLYLPMVSSKQSSELPPYSIQIAGLSQITATAAYANLTPKEAAAAQELLMAELDETFPTLVDALKQSGAGYVRVYVDWNVIQPTEGGAYSWSWYDTRLSQLNAAGLGLIATVTNAPTWAIDTTLDPCAYIITEVDAYYQFLEALVDHFPYIKIWEILNEPDAIPGYRCGSGVMNYGFAGAQYANLLQGAYTRIKALDPSATVIMGGMAYDHFVDEDPVNNKFNRYFLDAVMEAGGAPYMDGVNFHYFHDFAGSWEGWTAGNGDPTCEEAINLNEGGDDTFYYPYGFDITAKASHVAERLRVCHNVIKPQWLTEIGDHGIHPDNIDALDPLRVDDTLENQARYVFTVHARGFASGAENITWYALKIVPTLTDYDHQGLLYDERDGLLENEPKPAYYAYQTMTRELGDYRFDQWVSFDPRTRPAAEAYQFKHMAGATAGNPKLVAWSNFTSDVPLTLARSSIRVVSRPGNGIFAEEFIVTDGGSMDADGAVNGSISFNLKLEPVIIELVP